MTPLDRPSRSVTRLTVGTLGFGHGRDSKRRLSISLVFGDMLVLRPHGTRRPQVVMLTDVYSFALRSKANKEHMERLRERKAKKQAAREAARSWRIIRGGLTS